MFSSARASIVFVFVLGILLLPFDAGAKKQEKKAPEKKTAAAEAAAPEVTNAKYDDIALFGRVINFIEKQYVDKVNTKELVYGAIKGMLETLDPHSNFMPPEIYNQLKTDTAGKFGGLGIEVWVNKDGVLTVVTPMEGSPAWKAGIKPGDKIMAIDGESTKGMSIVEATSKIRGDIGKEIKFMVQRDGANKEIEFKMKRASIDVKSVRFELLADNVGYVRMNHFQEKTAEEVKAAIKKMEKKTKLGGVILDLRNNPGGLLDEAVETVNLFVDQGIIVSTIGRNKEEKDVKYAKSGIARLDFPMVVLVNGSSASAAEIVAGALKDHKRALIAGGRTFGKGSVQTVIPLAEDVGLKLTIARYYTPSGISIQAKGIEPDIFSGRIRSRRIQKSKEALQAYERSGPEKPYRERRRAGEACREDRGRKECGGKRCSSARD